MSIVLPIIDTALLHTIIYTLVGVLIVLVILGLLLRKLSRSFRHWMARRNSDLDREQMRKRWTRITGMLNTPDPETDKLAIIEADNLLDFVLKSMCMPGETMAFRLKYAQNKFYELKRIRWVHAIRNRAVHEPDFVLSKRQAQACISEYERALKLLGAL